MSEYYWAYDKYGNYRILKDFSGKQSLRLLEKVTPVEASDYSLGGRIIEPSDISNFEKLERSNFPNGFYWISFYEQMASNQRFHIIYGQRASWLLFDGWSMTELAPIDYLSIWVGPKIEVPSYNRGKDNERQNC